MCCIYKKYKNCDFITNFKTLTYGCLLYGDKMISILLSELSLTKSGRHYQQQLGVLLPYYYYYC